MIEIALFYIAIPFVVLAIAIYPMFFSKMARETRELSKLNKIIEPFGERKRTATEALELIKAIQWKYQQEKVKMFKNLLHEIIKQDKKHEK